MYSRGIDHISNFNHKGFNQNDMSININDNDKINY